MHSHVLLNHKEHLNTKIATGYSDALGDAVNSVMVFPIEFRDLQSHYPIYFQKHADTGRFYPTALLGFEGDENLFIDSGEWRARYVPLMMQKQPFFIGFSEDEKAIDGKAMMVTMDPDHPKVGHEHGEPVFNQDGSPTEFLQAKMDVLERVNQGNEHAEGFVSALTEYDLIEPFTMEITLENGSTNQLLGFYTINEDKVQALSGDVLAGFASNGYLISLFMVLASQSRVADLVELKNAKQATAA